MQKTTSSPAQVVFAGGDNEVKRAKTHSDSIVLNHRNNPESNNSSRGTTPTLSLPSLGSIPTALSEELEVEGMRTPASLGNPFENIDVVEALVTNQPMQRQQILQPIPTAPILPLDSRPPIQPPNINATNRNAAELPATATRSSKGANPPSFSISQPPTPFEIPFSQLGEQLVAYLEENI